MSKLPDIYADAILLAAVFIAALVVATLARAAFAAPSYCPDDALVSCWLRERPELPNKGAPDSALFPPTPDGGSR
jgi:hypothetical protein